MQWIVGILFGILCLITQSVYAKPVLVIEPSTIDAASLRAVRHAVEVIAQLDDDQDRGQADRLRRRARETAQTTLATQGYFAAHVTLTARDEANGRNIWHIRIEPGLRATVAAVDLYFTGQITAPQYRTRLEALRRAWSLPVGKPFINKAWSSAKEQLLVSVSERDFLQARIVTSNADVRVDTDQVHLKVEIDSGPAVRLGKLQIRGLKRVPASVVRSYVRYLCGDAYDKKRLDQWQQDLQSTTFFQGAFVSMAAPAGAHSHSDAKDAQAAVADSAASSSASDSSSFTCASFSATSDDKAIRTLPVQVRVVESPSQRWAAAVSLDSDVGLGFEANYRQQVVGGYPITLESGIGLNRKRQRAYMDFMFPPKASGNKDSFGLAVLHSDIEGQNIKRVAAGLRRLQERHGGPEGHVDYDTRWDLVTAHYDVKLPVNDNYNLLTTTATVDWLRRDVDDRYNPRQGNLIGANVLAGIVLDDHKTYGRLGLRGQQWWPIGRRDSLTVRGEIGRLWGGLQIQKLDDFGFRTGGSRSIRGYRYLSLGIDKDGAVVGAPTLLASSVEYDHYFNERWGVGLFVDAGDAAPSFFKRQLALGYGVGVRFRTPAGPLFLDVAYGQRANLFLLNFSLGTAL